VGGVRAKPGIASTAKDTKLEVVRRGAKDHLKWRDHVEGVGGKAVNEVDRSGKGIRPEGGGHTRMVEEG
jgi:hypothetical protein